MTARDDASGQNAGQVVSHYRQFNRAQAALDALQTRGRDIDRLTPSDLEPFDNLHTSGAAATVRLITLLDAKPDWRVLDIGSGLGGPARMLNDRSGASVDGLELTPAFIAAAQDFSRRTGQADTVQFHQASTDGIPFADATFDAAWHIHTSMHIPDKARFYREVARVLKPGGRFAMYDPVAGSGELRFPVPWSETSVTSFLVTQDAHVASIGAAGLVPLKVEDVTAEGLAWFASLKGLPSALPPEPHFAAMAANHRANLESGAVRLLRALFEKPAVARA
jgi:sarcosine/dimethylglycine N-methyltransferase